MSSVFLGSNMNKTIVLCSSICCKLLTAQAARSQLSSFWSRTITSKTYRDPDYKRRPPFPYKEKNYTLFHRLIDSTPDRFDENSKIIVVDGAVAAGKSAFAKALAEELDMLYMPEPTMDVVYINPYGYDMRQLDPQLPKSMRSYDTKKFCLDPNHFQAAYMQVMLYQIKYYTYIDVLAHVMNTGQGVVCDKSPYSDFVYAEAMAKEGFMSKAAKKVYDTVQWETLDELMRPHLAIYLDMPVEKVQEKVKQRGYPHEQNSNALSTSFLLALEDAYKRKYLKEIGAHAELLIYDWSDGGDTEVVVEDIERIDFDKYTHRDDRLCDWRDHETSEWNDKRKVYTDGKHELMTKFNVPIYDAPELVVDGEDVLKWNEVWFSAPGMNYAKGFNYDMGDKNIFTRFLPKHKYSYFS